MKKILSAIFLIAALSITAAAEEDSMLILKRQKMVKEQIEGRGITDLRVLDAMKKVRRQDFVPEFLSDAAYEDRPLPIGFGQTISQPYIVAYMTEAARIGPKDRVLEIGTGSGYQAAVLAEIAREVYTIEIIKPLAEGARERLGKMGYKNIKVKRGDGYKGWKERAPFDAIIVTAAPSEIPQELSEQLKVGGRMVVPIGSFFQDLYLVRRTKSGFEKKPILPVAFVPMVKGPVEEK